TLEEALALVDHATGRRPVDPSVPAAVLDEEQALRALDQRPSDQPPVHGASLAASLAAPDDRLRHRHPSPGVRPSTTASVTATRDLGRATGARAGLAALPGASDDRRLRRGRPRPRPRDRAPQL